MRLIPDRYKAPAIVLMLELYALMLTVFQMQQGVRTDEAKYLMDIPYPHPPLARMIMGMTDGWAYQEHFWRFIFASLMVQAAWLVVGVLKSSSRATQISMAGCWVLSSAVILQAGSVMMAPLTALQGLVGIWIYLRGTDNTRHAYLIGLFWLISLFTAYQAVLFAPVFFVLFLRLRLPLWQRAFLFVIPVVLLALYTLTNPLVPASMLNHAGKDIAETLQFKTLATLRLWLLAGSGVLSLTGLAGLIAKPRWPLICSMLLVCAYVFISRYDYYAILFTPLLIAGVIPLMKISARRAAGLVIATAVGSIIVLVSYPLGGPSPEKAVLKYLENEGIEEILITGSFGHQWQYSPLEVRRYVSGSIGEADAIICLSPCPDMSQQAAWEPRNLPVEVWIKK